MNNSQFRSGSAVYKCRECGKATRETGAGESSVRLCAPCYDYAGWENTHRDWDHDNYPDLDCPICNYGHALAGDYVAVLHRRLGAHAKAAVQSESAADAYRALADLVATDERFAILRESELPRLRAEADEYEDDAEYEREQARRYGYQPGDES